MQLVNEILNSNNNSPISFFIVKDNNVNRHWHQEYELIYVLEGSLEIIVNKINFSLNVGDMLLINPYEIHDEKSNANVLAVISLDPAKLNTSFNNDLPYFDCNSTTTETKEGFEQIMKIIAEIIQASNEKGENNYLNLYALAYTLLHCFTTHFLVDNLTSVDNKQFSRMDEILKYIVKNYNEGLTLQILSQKFYFTVPYLSKLFRKCTGSTFLDYLTDIRLKHSLTDLKTTSLSIDEIALNNGFPNTRSFTNSFKREHNILPSEYRKNLKTIPNEESYSPSTVFAYEHNQYLNVFTKYLEYDITHTSEKPLNKMQIVNVSKISVLEKGISLKHNFKNITSIGRMKQLLIAENQHILSALQKDVGFKYLISPGLLDDDMMVYSEDSKGNPKYNFCYIDIAFDFLLSIGLKPFVLLSYMPKALAKNPNRTMYHTESVISLPKDMTKWNNLIKALLLHLKTRYGMDEISSWLFSLWNKPDTPPHLFGFENLEDFFEFYRSTYITAKDIIPEINFGTPLLLPSSLTNKAWIKRFLDYCVANKCEPSFINFNFFASIIDFSEDIELIQRPHIKYSKDSDTLKTIVKHINQNLKSLGVNSKKLYMTEWNSTLSHRDLLNDTCFKSSYIIKNILENYDELSSFCFWPLSDANEQLILPDDLYHGGLGLYTYNGVKKAPYFALCFLSKLGNRLLSRGDGYFITKSNDSYQIILYNYVHYSDLYADGELFDMTFKNRYTLFSKQISKRFNITLEDLPFDKYIKTETILNRDHGSSFDTWVNMGLPKIQTNEDIEYLKSVSLPKILKEIVQVENGELTITTTLTPLEVKLITLKVDYT